MTNHYRWPDMGIRTADFRARLAGTAEPHAPQESLTWSTKTTCGREGKTRWGE